MNKYNNHLAWLAFGALLASVACSDDDASQANSATGGASGQQGGSAGSSGESGQNAGGTNHGGSNHGGSNQAGTAGQNTGAMGGSSGSAGTSGSAGSGAQGGQSICPSIVEPTVITQVQDALAIAPSGFGGGQSAMIDLDTPDLGWAWNDPHVLKVGDQYWMYASSVDNFEYPVRLYRLISEDGQQWHRDPMTPILDVGTTGSFDAGGVETPAVVFFQGQYHLFYTGYPIKVGDPGYAVTDFRIGHATSCDGITWVKDEQPVMGPSGTQDTEPSNDWYAFVVGEPGPVVHNDQLFLYFTAFGANTELNASLQVIGVTTSTDGNTWSTAQLAVEPDQTQYPRVIDQGPPVAGWVGYSTPNAISLNGEVHLFFDVAFDPDEAHWSQVRLHHAKSGNGLSGWEQDPMPIAANTDFDWTAGEIRAPAALIDGTTLRVYFAGHELDGTAPDHFGIGAMTLSLK